MASMLISVLVATFITQGTAQDTCTVAGEFELNLDSSVSICLSSNSSLSLKWTSVCSSGWTITHAKLACQQNSMDFQGAQVAVVDKGNPTTCVTFPDCNGYEQNLTECIRGHSFDLLSTTSSNLAGFMCGCSNGDVRFRDQPIEMDNSVKGAVQLCVHGEWETLCATKNNWLKQISNTIFAPYVVCRQLGYSEREAARGSVCSSLPTPPHFINPMCNGAERSLLECSRTNQGTTCPKLSCTGDNRAYGAVTCIKDCIIGTTRLVDGSTPREGRVEVCVGGRWGTVCSINHQEITGAVCSELGFPSNGVEVLRNGTTTEGTPVYSCTLTTSSSLSCTPTVNVNCDHSMDLGVVCKTHQDVIGSVINRTIDQTLQTCPEPTTTSGTNQPAPTTSEVDQFVTLANNKMMGSCPTAALGGLIGLLVVVLLGLAIGLTVTCCVLGKRWSQKQQAEYNISQVQKLSTIQRQLNNPVYDTSMELHSAYSSSGPTYEQVANGNKQDHTYSILERDKNINHRSFQLNPIDEEQNYHVVESGRCVGVEGAGCCDGVYSEASNYEVPMSSKTDSKVWLCEEDYSTLKH
ncbi:scavenger receptor cysteine-rich domain superfamily protein-like isoform X2 [Halichondria panicea]|uniref:scavenger receptor cysteine-rich domain superfamily protein-like isoform X3 n=1 Tax=Halichondria panicea TaxID=6063 RepID=UPI00312B3003